MWERAYMILCSHVSNIGSSVSPSFIHKYILVWYWPYLKDFMIMSKRKILSDQILKSSNNSAFYIMTLSCWRIQSTICMYFIFYDYFSFFLDYVWIDTWPCQHVLIQMRENTVY